MTPYIHNNLKIIKDLEILFKTNNIEDIKNFYNKNQDLIKLNEYIFYKACNICNLKIVKFIYNDLSNKNINFRDAIFSNCNLYNIKVFKWLIKKYKLNNHDIFQCLNYCILNNNDKLFKFIHHKFKYNLTYSNLILLKLSINKGNISITKDILTKINYIFDSYDFIFFKYACYSNNLEMINLINQHYNFMNEIINQDNILNFIIDIIKRGNLITIKYLINNYYISCLIENNINHIIFNCFISNNIQLVDYILNLNYHSSIDYQYIYNKIVNFSNLEVIKYIYTLDIKIHLLNLTSLSIILQNNLFDIFKFCLMKESNYFIESNLLSKYTELIQLHFLNSLNYLDIDHLILFFKFIDNNKIIINNNIYILNYLIMYNHLDKIKFLDEKYPSYLNYNESFLFYDCLYSNNIKNINYVLNKLNINIELIENIEYKNKILEHAYVYGLLDIITIYDKENNEILNNIHKILITNITKNNLTLIELILKKIKNNNLLIDDLNSVIYHIFKIGNYQILQLFLEYFPLINLKNMKYLIILLKDENYFFFYNIIKNIISFEFIDESLILIISKCGDIKIINWFFNLDINLSLENINQAFENLIHFNHFDQAIYFYNKLKNKYDINLFNNNFKSLIYCCSENNILMIKWFFNQFNQVDKIKFLIDFEYNNIIKNIIINDNEIILKYIIDFYHIENIYIILKFAIHCLNQKKYYCLSYLLENYNINEELLTIDFKKYFDQGVDELNYNLIDIIIKHINDFDWLIYSAKKNYYTIFVYILKYLKIHLNLNEDTFFNLSYLKDIRYIKTFLYYCNNINYEQINADHLSILVSYDNLEMVKFLYQLNNKIDFNHNDSYILKLSITLQFDSITYWLLNNIMNLDLHVQDNLLFKTACMNNNLQLLKTLYNYSDKIDFSEYNQFYLNIAIYYETPYLFKWIYFVIKNISPDKLDQQIYIKNSIYHNNLFILKFLLSEYPDFDINFDNGYIMRICFGNNYNDIIKYLFDTYNNIDVLVENEIIMKYAIEDDDLEMIELLYEYNSNFNLSINDEYLFKTACKTNNLNIAKWLISKKHDIYHDINNHEIFYFVCEQEYINICQYLCELDSNYKINVEDNRIISYNVTKILNINYDMKKKVTSIDNCPICFETSELITPCEHQFCKTCLKSINNKNHDFSCPLCRDTINELYQMTKDD